MSTGAVTRMRTCTECGESKPPGEFHLADGLTGRRRNQCRDCVNASMRLRKQPPDAAPAPGRAGRPGNRAASTEAMLAQTAPGRAASAASRRQRVLARTSKTCPCCNRDQPVSQFKPAGHDGPGRYSWCRQCLARAADKRRERRKAEAARDRETEAELPENLQTPLCAGCGKRRALSAYRVRRYTRYSARCEACRAMVGSSPVFRAAHRDIASRLDAEADALRAGRQRWHEDRAIVEARRLALYNPPGRINLGPRCPGCTPDLGTSGDLIHGRGCPVAAASRARTTFASGWRKCADCAQQLPPGAFRPDADTCESCRELARDERARSVAPTVDVPRTAAPVLPAYGAKRDPHQARADGVFA